MATIGFRRFVSKNARREVTTSAVVSNIIQYSRAIPITPFGEIFKKMVFSSYQGKLWTFQER
jgi:hypothetical protein